MSAHPVKILPLAALLALAPLALTACDKKGPAERAGEKIDDAAEKAGDKLHDAGETAREKIEDGANKVEEKLDKTNGH